MLRLSADVVKEMLRWAGEYPTVEVTGMVIEHGGSGLQRVRPMQNIAKDPSKYYAWDIREMGQVFKSMDRTGEWPIAIYHSHPGGKPDPSETDMQGAVMEGMHYLILYPCRDDMGGPDCWHVSAWECLEPGILVKAPCDMEGDRHVVSS